MRATRNCLRMLREAARASIGSVVWASGWRLFLSLRSSLDDEIDWAWGFAGGGSKTRGSGMRRACGQRSEVGGYAIFCLSLDASPWANQQYQGTTRSHHAYNFLLLMFMRRRPFSIIVATAWCFSSSSEQHQLKLSRQLIPAIPTFLFGAPFRLHTTILERTSSLKFMRNRSDAAEHSVSVKLHFVQHIMTLA